MGHLEMPGVIGQYVEGRLDIVWHCPVPARIEYSMVAVPLNVGVVMEYISPSRGTRLNLSPDAGGDPKIWTLDGIFDADVVQLLDFPVDQPRAGRTPPVLSAANIDRLGRLGIQPIDNSGTFQASKARLFTWRIYRFLHGVWQPHQNPANLEQRWPGIYLGDKEDHRHWGTRILPQKESGRNAAAETSLWVSVQ